MTKWMPDALLDYALEQIRDNSETVAVCDTAPTTYFHAKKGVVWAATTAIALGEVRYPPVWNDFVYECIVAGDTGSSEPPWGTNQDDEFSDGTVTWKTHANYSMVNDTPGTAAITSETFGKRLTFAATTGSLSYKAGTVTHTALLDDTNQSLLYVVDAETDEVGSNDILSGRIVQINQIIIDRNNVA